MRATPEDFDFEEATPPFLKGFAALFKAAVNLELGAIALETAEATCRGPVFAL